MADPDPSRGPGPVRWATLDEVLAEIAAGDIHDLITIAGVGAYAAAGRDPMTELTVLRVFVGSDGGGGQPAGVRLDGAAPSPRTSPSWSRQRSGSPRRCSWTTLRPALIRIYTPARGAGVRGVIRRSARAWLLHRPRAGWRRSSDRPAGEVVAWQDGDRSPELVGSVLDPPDRGRPRTRVVRAVEALPGRSRADRVALRVGVIDEPAGTPRRTYFVPAFGIGEDEATGAAAVMMGGLLGRDPSTSARASPHSCWCQPRDRTARSRSAGGSSSSRRARSARRRAPEARVQRAPIALCSSATNSSTRRA